MQSVLSIFQDELARIKSYVAASEETIRFGSTPSSIQVPPEVSAFKAVIQAAGLRVFRTSFDGALLTLGASFEQFVRGIVSRFLETLPGQVHTYGDLPDAIQESNERLTGEALAGRLPNYLQINRSDLVQNLYNCQQGLTPYILNSQVIASSERNFTASELGEFLRRLGITRLWDQISEESSVQSWAGANSVSTASPRVQVKLNEFISDRNNLAHRGSEVPSLGPSTIREYLDYFDVLGPALVHVCELYLQSIG